MTNPSTSQQCEDWSFAEHKQFEECLALYYLDYEDEATRWREISLKLGQKISPIELEIRYKKLLLDVELIESGQVSLPRYKEDLDDDQDLVSHKGACIPSPLPIKKGAQWTGDEHRLFLIGLEIYGKGDWRSISRHLVKTRSATPVASHAQKYFNRTSPKKNRKRSSIHDIKGLDDNSVIDLGRKGLISSDIVQKFIQRGSAFSDVDKTLQPYFDAKQLESILIPDQCDVQAKSNNNICENQLQTTEENLEQVNYMPHNQVQMQAIHTSEELHEQGTSELPGSQSSSKTRDSEERRTS